MKIYSDVFSFSQMLIVFGLIGLMSCGSTTDGVKEPSAASTPAPEAATVPTPAPASDSYTLDDLGGSWKIAGSENSIYVFQDATYIYQHNGVERLRQKIKMIDNCQNQQEMEASKFYLLYGDNPNSGVTCYEIVSLEEDVLVLNYHQEDGSSSMTLNRVD